MRLGTLTATLAALSMIALMSSAQVTSGSGWQLTPEVIRQAQKELRRLGYLSVEPSGNLNRPTRTALRRYQADRGLPLTARIDRPTFDSLGLLDQGVRRAGEQQPAIPLSAGANQGEAPGLPARLSSATVATVGKGLRESGKTLRVVDREVLGREDQSVLREVREILDRQLDPDVARWSIKVRKGLVTIIMPVSNRHDPGSIVSEVRRVAGVEAVLVVAR